MVIYGDMVCLALALAPSCAALHFWCLYIMLSKSYLPRRCDWKDGVSYKSPYGINGVIRTSSFQIVLIDTARNQTLPCSDLTLNSIRISLLVGDSATPGPSSSSVAVENRMGLCWEVSPGKKKSSFFTTEKRFFTTIQLRQSQKTSSLKRLQAGWLCGSNFWDPLIICPWDAFAGNLL